LRLLTKLGTSKLADRETRSRQDFSTAGELDLEARAGWDQSTKAVDRGRSKNLLMAGWYLSWSM